MIVSASYQMSMVVQPMLGVWQDRGDKKKITVLLLCLSAGTGIAFLMSRSLPGLLVFYGATITLVNSATPYIEKSATVSRFPYRSIRIWGTIGYGVGAQIAGVVYDHLSPGSMYCLFAVMILLAAAGVWGSRGLGETTESAGDQNTGVRKAGNGRQEKQPATEYRQAVLANRKFLVYILIAALFYATTSLNSTYIPMLYQEAGLSVSTSSTILFAATLMELPVIFFASAYMNRFTGKQLLLAVFCILILQFSAYAFAPWTMVKIAATVLLKSSVTMIYIMLNIKVVSALVSPLYQMSALTLVSALSRNMITILIQNIGGTILDRLSVNALYGMLSGLAVLGFVLTALVRMPKEQEQMRF